MHSLTSSEKTAVKKKGKVPALREMRIEHNGINKNKLFFFT